MALLLEADLQMRADRIAQILGTELQNCADASLSVCGFSTDTRTIGQGNCFIALKGENFDGNAYAKSAAEKGAVLCLLSAQPPEDPGVPYLIVPDTVKAYGKLANAYLREQKAAGLHVIGVTGSSGKTTVKDMIAHVLSAKYRTYATSGNHNNHIGVPFTLLHMPEETEYAVIEMGMNHAGEISYLTQIAEPDAAVITNVGTAHIGNLGSQENILHAKLEILDGMQNGTLFLPADDALLFGAQTEIRPRAALRFSTRLGHEAAELCADQITETAENTRFTLHFDGAEAEVLLPMTGLHNVSDALLAVHVGLYAGMTLAECANALADFTPGANRSERVRYGNITIIRDFYNANPEAMAAALRSFGTIAGDAQKWAILGNMNELGDFAAARHRELGALAKEFADKAFFCGGNYMDFAEGYADDACAFPDQDTMMEALDALLRTYVGVPICFLIKGSRGMHMERVNAMLEKLFGADQAHAE